MESTGVYWKPVFNLLEAAGIEVIVAEQFVELETLLARIAEARSPLDQTSRIGAGIRKAQSSLDATLKLDDKIRNDITAILDQCQALIAPALRT